MMGNLNEPTVIFEVAYLILGTALAISLAVSLAIFAISKSKEGSWTLSPFIQRPLIVVVYLAVARVAIQMADNVGHQLFPSGNELLRFAIGATVMIITAIIILGFQRASKK